MAGTHTHGAQPATKHAVWQQHLENVRLRDTIQELRRLLARERRLTELWRTRAMNGRPPGRATRKTRP